MLGTVLLLLVSDSVATALVNSVACWATSRSMDGGSGDANVLVGFGLAIKKLAILSN